MKAKLSQRNERMRSTDLCVKASECVHPDPRLDLAATEITNSNAGSMTTSASPSVGGGRRVALSLTHFKSAEKSAIQ